MTIIDPTKPERPAVQASEKPGEILLLGQEKGKPDWLQLDELIEHLWGPLAVQAHRIEMKGVGGSLPDRVLTSCGCGTKNRYQDVGLRPQIHPDGQLFYLGRCGGCRNVFWAHPVDTVFRQVKR